MAEILIRISSAVEQWTVNPLVVGSNPTSGVSLIILLSLDFGVLEASRFAIMLRNRFEVLGNGNSQSRYFRAETSTHSPEQDAKIDVSKTPKSRSHR